MINRTVTGDDYFNSSYPTIRFSKGLNVQYGNYGTSSPANRLAIAPPIGWYPGGGAAYITAEASEVAGAIGIDANTMLNTKTVCNVTGTIPIMGSEEYPGWRRAVLGTVAAAEGRAHFCIPDGYYNGTVNNGMQGIFADDSGFSAANIISGKSIFGLAGTATNLNYASGTSTINAAFKFNVTVPFTIKAFKAYGSIYGSFNCSGDSIISSYIMYAGGSYKIFGVSVSGNTYTFTAHSSSGETGGMEGVISWNAYGW